MSELETILLEGLVSAESLAPLFVSSGKSQVYLGASESFINALVQAGLTKQVVVPTPVTVAAAPAAAPAQVTAPPAPTVTATATA